MFALTASCDGVVAFNTPIRVGSIMSAADSPESETGVTEAAAAVPPDDEAAKYARQSHGGSRNRQAYSDKLLCMEMHNIRSFLAKKRCYCGKKCLAKLALTGEAAERSVYDMRSARFASK